MRLFLSFACCVLPVVLGGVIGAILQMSDMPEAEQLERKQKWDS